MVDFRWSLEVLISRSVVVVNTNNRRLEEQGQLGGCSVVRRTARNGCWCSVISSVLSGRLVSVIGFARTAMYFARSVIQSSKSGAVCLSAGTKSSGVADNFHFAVARSVV